VGHSVLVTCWKDNILSDNLYHFFAETVRHSVRKSSDCTCINLLESKSTSPSSAYRGSHWGFIHRTSTSYWNLTFSGPRIVIYSYNKSQRYALFLKFILVKNPTCFGHTYCPSSGVLIPYPQHSSILTSLADSQHNQYDKHQLLCIQY
jgi:hypothetical protein